MGGVTPSSWQDSRTSREIAVPRDLAPTTSDAKPVRRREARQEQEVASKREKHEQVAGPKPDGETRRPTRVWGMINSLPAA